MKIVTKSEEKSKRAKIQICAQKAPEKLKMENAKKSKLCTHCKLEHQSSNKSKIRPNRGEKTKEFRGEGHCGAVKAAKNLPRMARNTSTWSTA